LLSTAALAVALAPVTVLAAPASAVPVPAVLHLDTEDRITWGVKPANADGPDGRRGVDLVADPGETIEEHIAVSNFGDVAATFALKAADGYLTANGRFNMLPSDQESVDAGTWFTVQETV